MKYTTLVSFLAVSLVIAAPAQATGDAEAGQAKAQACFACHGANGNSTVPNFPKLAGQHGAYIAKQLADFKAGKTRSNAVMAPQVANLSDQDMADLAAFFAKQSPSLGRADKKLAVLGEKLYRGGNMDKGIPACAACHGPTGTGNPPAAYPLLSGQHSAYMMQTLKDFRDGKRKNDPNGMMRDIAAKMSDAEIEAVASYISGLH